MGALVIKWTQQALSNACPSLKNHQPQDFEDISQSIACCIFDRLRRQDTQPCPLENYIRKTARWEVLKHLKKLREQSRRFAMLDSEQELNASSISFEPVRGREKPQGRMCCLFANNIPFESDYLRELPAILSELPELQRKAVFRFFGFLSGEKCSRHDYKLKDAGISAIRDACRKRGLL